MPTLAEVYGTDNQETQGKSLADVYGKPKSVNATMRPKSFPITARDLKRPDEYPKGGKWIATAEQSLADTAKGLAEWPIDILHKGFSSLNPERAEEARQDLRQAGLKVPPQRARLTTEDVKAAALMPVDIAKTLWHSPEMVKRGEIGPPIAAALGAVGMAHGALKLPKQVRGAVKTLRGTPRVEPIREAAPAGPKPTATLNQVYAGKPKADAFTAEYMAKPKPTATLNEVYAGRGNSVVAVSEKYTGVKYRWGGTKPESGLDCSALTQRVMAENGVEIPRTSAMQFKAGQAVNEPAPGDLVFFDTKGKGNVTHVGVYLGDGKFRHASTTHGVTVSDLANYQQRYAYKGARRFVSPNVSVTEAPAVQPIRAAKGKAAKSQARLEQISAQMMAQARKHNQAFEDVVDRLRRGDPVAPEELAEFHIPRSVYERIDSDTRAAKPVVEPVGEKVGGEYEAFVEQAAREAQAYKPGVAGFDQPIVVRAVRNYVRQNPDYRLSTGQLLKDWEEFGLTKAQANSIIVGETQKSPQKPVVVTPVDAIPTPIGKAADASVQSTPAAEVIEVRRGMTPEDTQTAVAHELDHIRTGERPTAQQEYGAREPWEMTREAFADSLDVRQNEPVALTQPVTIPFSRIKVNRRGLENAAERAKQFTADYQQGAEFPPLTVIPQKDGTFLLDDGYHRYSAMATRPPAEVRAILKFPPETSFALRDRTQVAPLHRQMVSRAISENKPVPPGVLAEYPDLAAKYQPAPAAAKSPPKTRKKVAGIAPEGQVAKPKAAAKAEVPPARPMVNPHATALKQDAQLKAQQAWDRKYGVQVAQKPTPQSVTPAVESVATVGETPAQRVERIAKFNEDIAKTGRREILQARVKRGEKAGKTLQEFADEPWADEAIAREAARTPKPKTASKPKATPEPAKPTTYRVTWQSQFTSEHGTVGTYESKAQAKFHAKAYEQKNPARTATVEEPGAAVSKLDEIEQAAFDRIAKRRAQKAPTPDGKKGQGGFAYNPADDFADAVIIGAAKFARGAVKFKDWSVEMVKHFGNEIRPHLNKIFRQVRQDREQALSPGYEIVQKVKRAVGSSKSDVKALLEMQSKERSRRAAIQHRLAERHPGAGQELTRRQLGAMKGELAPRQFEPIRGQFTQAEVDAIHNMIEGTDRIHPKDRYERTALKDAFDKLLDGYIPNQSTLNLFDKVFGRSFTDALLQKLPLKNKLKSLFWQLWDTPKTLRFTADISFTGRQGALLGTGHPKEYARMFADGLRAIRSDADLDAIEWSIREHPGYSDLQKSGLQLTQTGRFTSADMQNDYFRSLPLLEKIPGVGHVVKASNRNWEAASDSIKSGIFYKIWEANNGKMSAFDSKELATALNRLSGRGEVPGFEKSMTALGRIFNAPRWFASQVQSPAGLVSGSKTARAVTARSLVAYTTAGLAVLGLLKARGATVETDPTHTDFGKARFGNTRIDLGLGRNQFVRTVARLWTGKKITARGEGKADPGQEAWRFAQGRLHPSIGIVGTAFTGKMPVTGEKATPATMFWSGLPLTYQDVADAATLPDSLPWYEVGPLAAAGVSVQTYTQQGRGRRTRSRTRQTTRTR